MGVTVRRWAVFCLLGFLAGGCARTGVASDPAAERALLTSMQVYTAGEGATMVLQVTNTSDESLRLRFPDARIYDFAVLRGGEEIWRWSADRSFAQAVHEVRIEAGETLRYEAVWSGSGAASGAYEAVGTLPAIGATIEQTARFELP